MDIFLTRTDRFTSEGLY